MIGKRIALAAVTAMAASAPAPASVTISSAATQNMSCSGGVCAPTQADAVLNASDLENYLSQFGNVVVKTKGNHGVQAKSIIVKADFASPDSTSLTLEAHGAITFDAAVSIGSHTAELELQSDEGGVLGTISFSRKGHITFGSLKDIFGINGGIFTLVDSVQGLAAAVAANPSGAYALAKDYDASHDGTYSKPPINALFGGIFEGLGNTIRNVGINDSQDIDVGFFSSISSRGLVSDIGLSNANVTASYKWHSGYIAVGALAGANSGTIRASHVEATVSSQVRRAFVGGLSGTNGQLTTNASSDGEVSGGNSVSGAAAGGLVDYNTGVISNSYSTATVKGSGGGGLVADNDIGGTIMNSYATGSVYGVGGAGGLIAGNIYGSVADSYSVGDVSGSKHAQCIGGLIGYDEPNSGQRKHTYWDTDTSGITNPSQGAGCPLDDPGIKAKTTAQLQSKLPKGFDHKVWAENPNINNGLPYLIDNPPK